MNMQHLEAGSYVVAVSGGVDSMALLHMLKHQPGLNLVVTHFDHGIREDSKLDRQLVQQVAEDYKLPFVYGEGHLGKQASEAAAREARYAFLQRIREFSKARAIVTAHHQDDAVETAVINWIRGTGRRGYTALGSQGNILRPLLDVPKQELINYARSNKLQWREDSTNKDSKYLRNLIRHKVLPQLTARQRADMVKTLQHLRGLNDQIDQKLVHFLHTQPTRERINRHWFIMLPHGVAVEVMAMWLRLNNCAFDTKLLGRLVAGAKTLAIGKQMDIDKNHRIKIGQSNLALTTRER